MSYGGGGPPAAAPFPVPDILDNASFEADFQGWTNWAYGAPTGVTRDGGQHYAGVTAVRKVLPVTAVDIGSQFVYPWVHIGPLPEQDRLWTRFFFYQDVNIDGGIKFTRYFDSGFNLPQLGGFGTQAGYLLFRIDPEGLAVFPSAVTLLDMTPLVAGWHSLEVDYWRNGDPSGFPSVAFWLDNVPVVSQVGALPPAWAWAGGRLNPGRRDTNNKLGVFELIGLINGNPPNTVPGNIWVDKVSISTLGRIGP